MPKMSSKVHVGIITLSALAEHELTTTRSFALPSFQQWVGLRFGPSESWRGDVCVCVLLRVGITNLVHLRNSAAVFCASTVVLRICSSNDQKM